jgi:hypothetical protein
MTSSESGFNITRWGNILDLAHTNYNNWKDGLIHILSPMRAYPIITGENPQPQPIDFHYDNMYNDWKRLTANAASMMRLSCSPTVRHIVRGIRNVGGMWKTLQTHLDPAGSWNGRHDILHQFLVCRLKENEPLTAYFTRLSNYGIQLDNTDNAITNEDFCKDILTSLPSQYAMVLMVRKHRRPIPTPQEAMHDHP